MSSKQDNNSEIVVNVSHVIWVLLAGRAVAAGGAFEFWCDAILIILDPQVGESVHWCPAEGDVTPQRSVAGVCVRCVQLCTCVRLTCSCTPPSWRQRWRKWRLSGRRRQPPHTPGSAPASRAGKHAEPALMKLKSKRQRLKVRDKSAHRCVKVCDWRQGPGRRSGAGIHAAGPDDGLHGQLRTEPALAPVAGNLPVPADAVRSVWVSTGGVFAYLKKERLLLPRCEQLVLLSLQTGLQGFVGAGFPHTLRAVHMRIVAVVAVGEGKGQGFTDMLQHKLNLW